MSHDLLVQMAYLRLHDIQKKTVSHQEPIIWSKQLPNFAVMDPYLQIRRRGGGREGGSHLDPEISGGPGSKKFFGALQASIWSKNKGGGTGHPGPSPGSAPVLCQSHS